ncbi:MAG TPA: dockerin type I domain-containing protein, partial [Chthoniobacterales bacterium]|nr:dockerin type I domain-containing protein [Chthoniobacterales bacterium]
GWGEPAAFNNFVHLVYAQHGTGSDPGDVYYIRSTDGGVTFGTPLKLNTDSTTRPQWQPNLSVSPGGTLLATWYDARVSADTACLYGNPTSPCYQMFSRKSNDNGATWLPDDTLSDVVSPLPAQPDGNVQGTYAGDYDYGTAITTKHLTSWDDGRMAISSTAQQDVFTDKELVGFSVTSTVPACNSIINTQLTQFVVNLSDPALVSSVQASDFTVNGIPANTFTLSNGNATITFTFNTSPVTTQGPQTMHIPAGAILRNSDSMPIFDFTCTFCYAVTPLQVTTTVPPVGGTFSPPAPGTYSYAVNFNQAIDPGSVSTSDLTLTGNVGGTVTNVAVAGSTATFTVNFQFGGSVTASIAAGAITAEGCNGNAAFTGNYTVEGCPMMGWSPGASLPSVGVRSVGVFFPANGKFYAMGGRSSDLAGSDFTHPFEYDPMANTWTTKAATFPDPGVNNMACGVLTVGGTPQIYCTGGNQAGGATSNARVFSYNPVTDTISTLTAADNWPGDASGTILPGGFAVVNNKLYTLGGFNINVASTNQIWQFDPTAGVGAKWTQEMNTPEGIMYAPTCAIGGIIYVAGASDYSGGLVIDTTNSFSFNPGTNTIGTIAPIPRATGETRALTFNGKMLVMGGGRVSPNPSNEVDAYDPGTNTWTVNTPVPAFMTARRNFPTDTDGTANIWLSGGYAPSTPTDSTEVFGGGGAPMAQSAFSRKVHGAAGTFDIPLPLTGNVGVECRSGGGVYQMIIDFPTTVTVQSASVTSGTGMVSSFSGSGTSEITVNLSGVTDQQRITMTLHGVNECAHMADVPISMGVLIGDVNGNGTVSSADVALTKSQVGQTVGGPNFREDVNVNGTISSTDVALVKSDVGHALPP